MKTGEIFGFCEIREISWQGKEEESAPRSQLITLFIS